MITLQEFVSVIGCTQMTAALWYSPMCIAMAEAGIDTPVRVAAFLAQVGHESGSLNHVEEDMRYGAQRLMQVWPKRFPTIDSAHYYEYDAERLANFVYANRLGNGAYESGDGYRYRGRGPIQITGGANYRHFGQLLNLPLIEQPDLAEEPKHGSRIAARLFAERGCNEVADDCDAVSDLINLGHATPKVGDAIGYADRKTRFDHALKVLQ